MSDGIRRMLRERQLLNDREAAAAHAQRTEEVRAAYLEGHVAGMDVREPGEAWRSSAARSRLAQPLPEGTFCRCGSDQFRLAIASDDWICDRCLLPALSGPLKPRPISGNVANKKRRTRQ